MLKFLQKKFGYGLAGFFVGLCSIAMLAKTTKGDISSNYLWAAPIGFIVGLFFPQEITSSIFFTFIRSASKNKSIQEDVDPDEIQTGIVVKVIHVFGILLLIFLAYVVFQGLKTEIFQK